MAADRGPGDPGPYAVVRHPLYASYLPIQSGYLLQSISLRNVPVMVLASGGNAGRALMEERLLARTPGNRAGCTGSAGAWSPASGNRARDRPAHSGQPAGQQPSPAGPRERKNPPSVSDQDE